MIFDCRFPISEWHILLQPPLKFSSKTNKEYTEIKNPDLSLALASTTKKFGLILYRLAMILTTLRHFDNGVSENNFICSDDDFAIALSLVRVYQKHAVFMLGELPKNGVYGKVKTQVSLQFLQSLQTRLHIYFYICPLSDKSLNGYIMLGEKLRELREAKGLLQRLLSDVEKRLNH